MRKSLQETNDSLTGDKRFHETEVLTNKPLF